MLIRLFALLLYGLYSNLSYAQTDLAKIADVFPELKVIQSTGLPIRVAEEDWAGARAKVASDPGWKGWPDSRRKSLDLWIAAIQDSPEWVGGDMHELLDPATQLPLKWSVDLPMPVGSSEIARKSREGWVAWMRNGNFYRVQEAARLYRLTGETKYGEWAASQLDFYANNYSSWPLRDIAGRARMMGRGLDEATGCVPLLDAVRLLTDFAAAARLQNWRDKLFLPIARQLVASRHADNIRLWQVVAVTMIGLQYGDQSLIKEGLDGPTGVRFMLNKGITPDYLWYEGSFGYQTYVLRALAPLFVHASLLGPATDFYADMLAAQNLLLSPLQFRFDDGMLPTPGDSGARLKAIDLGFYLEMYRTLPNRISLIEATRKKSWETLIDPVSFDSTGLTRLPQVQTKNFESIRMAILKADGWQAFIRYGQLVMNHSQQDALSAEFYFEDTPVSVSPGTVAYGSPLHSDYFHRVISHNTVLVDGEGQTDFDPGVVDSFTTKPPTITARQPKLTNVAAAKRTITIRDSVLVDQMSLSINPTVIGNRRLGFLFHTDCQLFTPTPALTAEPPTGTGFKYWEKVTVQKQTRGWHGRLRCDKTEFAVTFSLNTQGAIYFGKTPTKPLPALRDSLYFEVQGRSATLEMHLKPIRR